MSELLKLAQELIRKESVTPEDAGCQQLISDLLLAQGFNVEQQRFEDVDNMFAWHGNEDADHGGLFFLGHTDVVPTGNLKDWTHPPYAAHVKGDLLYGRGAADMKGSVAAMTLALIDFVKSHPNHKSKVGLMLTSDEEGPAVNGVKKMMPHVARNHQFTHCLVGEPSSSESLGDVVRIGRRGSLHLKITVHGVQGHVAYPEKAENPVFKAAPLIAELEKFVWDSGMTDFPPTSFQISSVKTSTNTSNIIPGTLEIYANFRHSPKSNQNTLETQMIQLIEKHNLKCDMHWTVSGEPFYNQCEKFKSTLNKSIKMVTNNVPIFNAGGGTSDGRYVAPYNIHVMELGPVNSTIHKVDECVSIIGLHQLKTIYYHILSEMCRGTE